MSSQFETILYEVRENIALITLNRPEKMNAMNQKMLNELVNALEDANYRDDVRVIILKGSGRAFSAGADIGMFREFVESGKPAELWRREVYHRIGLELYDLMTTGKPIVAAVNGYALGGGFEILLLCDIIIASESAKFGQPEVNIGIMPGFGTMLLKYMPHNKAKELVLLGEMMDARQLEQLGFVNKVVPPEKLDETALAIAKKLAAKPPLAIRAIKRVMTAAMVLQPGFQATADAVQELFKTEDAAEGFRAFLEKRVPEFRGR